VLTIEGVARGAQLGDVVARHHEPPDRGIVEEVHDAELEGHGLVPTPAHQFDLDDRRRSAVRRDVHGTGESRRQAAAPMMGFIVKLFVRPQPIVSEATPRDAADMAALHGASFHRGWSEDEFERLLLDRAVVAHRVMIGRRLAGFIISRIIMGEAEILSVAVVSARRGKGLARQMLNLHLRRLSGFGTRTVFLEVDEGNVPANRLYQRAGFRTVGRRDDAKARHFERRPDQQPGTGIVVDDQHRRRSSGFSFGCIHRFLQFPYDGYAALDDRLSVSAAQNS